jgi:oligoendopeptidase F
MPAVMNETVAIPQRNKRTYLSEDFVPSSWEVTEPYYNELLSRRISSVEELKTWLHNWSELEAVGGEYSRWIYVRTTIDTGDDKAKADLTNLFVNIVPKLSAQDNLLKKKFIECPFTDQLDPAIFSTTIRRMRREIEIFREVNIPLQSELSLKQSKFNEIAGVQSIHYKGSEITIEQAAVYLADTDREVRSEVFHKIGARRLEDREKLDDLLSELIRLRNQIALNAGYKNYMEYRFAELGRFDYTPEDCLKFHEVIHETVKPLLNKLFAERKQQLGVAELKPWDLDVDTSGKAPLKPFNSAAELVEKTITCFNKLDTYFGERISIMNSMKYLDLESRMRKSPGGYNMTMPEIGVPFIFMNSANNEHDLITIVHEGGHAIHTFLTHDLELTAFKELPSEIAEVASMGMELLSMEYWDIFYSNPDDLKRARKNHLKYILSVLSRTCLGDSFQFWLYSNPTHTVEERRKKWRKLQIKFGSSVLDDSDDENIHEINYQRIMHFYEVPFYYIEYAFAQLGALALWRNFKHNPTQTVNNYKKALSLGYTKPIPVFYETAGAKFDFSKPYISGLISFLEEEIGKL